MNVVDELAKLTVEQQQQQQQDLDDDVDQANDDESSSSFLQQTSNNVAIFTLQRSLFLENKDTIRDIARDCVKIYSRTQEERADRGFFKESTSKPYVAAYLDKLLNRKQPTKLFLGIQFRQVIGFIIGQNRDSFPDHINYLLSFINELRAAHSTSTQEDQKLLKSLAGGSIIPDYHAITKDASLYLYRACIEAARFCINDGNMQRVIGANDLVNILDSILSHDHKFSEKYSARFLVIFIQSLEKALGLDLENSLRRSSFVPSSANSKIHTSYNQILQDWIVRNREKLAELSLKVDDSANCWTNVDIILHNDLTLKRKCFAAKARSPLETGTNSSDARKLSLMIEAAKRLGDLDLLYGIRSLVNDSHEICDIPSLDPMISNLNGNFEETHINLANKCNELDERSLNEFLKACVEMNLLRENSMNIDLLGSNWLEDSYRKLIESTAVTEESLEIRLQEAKQWLGTWSDSRCPLDIDLMMSAYLRKVSKPSQRLIEPASHEEAEWFLSRDFISQTLFDPTKIASPSKIHSILFEMLQLKDEDKHLPTELVRINSKNLRWNNVLFRHFHDLNWLDLLRRKDDKIINLVQYRAIKYNIHCKNTQTAMKISEDLLSKGTCDKAKIHCLLLTMNKNQSNSEKYDEILDKINLSPTIGELDKNDLRLKVFRFLLRASTVREAADSSILKASYESGHLRLVTSGELSMLDWQDIFQSSRSLSKVRSLSLISKICHSKIESSLNNKEQSVNSVFRLDLELLKQLNQQISFKCQSLAVECAIRILKSICDHHSNLDQEATKLFASQTFLGQTMRTWILIKSNLISLVSNNRGDALPALWRRAIVELMKVMVSKHPNILLYSTIVSRLESRVEIRPDSAERVDNSSGSLEGEKIELWPELYACIKTETDNGIDNWLEMVQETEQFVKELRRISYLCGENLHSLASDINRKLTRFLNFMRKQQPISCDGLNPVNGGARRLELAARFRSICEFALKQIGILLLFSKGPNLDTYGTWFKTNMVKNLQIIKILIEDNLNQLVKFDLSEEFLEDLQSFMRQVNNLFYECQTIISNYSQKLWMHLISPKLSRQNSSKIPMPGCPMSEFCDSKKQPVTIYKVSQTVELIASKTKPKRLILIGSDGIQRSYLLKAHEDLRQDQYMMDLFVVINKLMSGRKELNHICRLRNYSVTPISSESGLIEWVKAPALADIYKTWLASPSGEKLTDDMYSSTCELVCDTTSHVGRNRSNHINCQMPHNLRATDIFFQLLWSEARKVDKQSELIEQRPSRETIHKYRTEYDQSLFENVIEQLSNQVPNDLISKSLWHRSINSNAYWRKTKQFTHSCATMSMVGYILGLGDRHLGNILLDYDTGEMIHIDFTLFFELGRRITVPEKVPFRLTNTITRAFGFAGLEGGFTQTSRKVLNFLKDNKSILLHLLEPTNWFFMIVSPNVDVKERSPYTCLKDHSDPYEQSDMYDDRIERWLKKQNIPPCRNHTEQSESQLESQLNDHVSVIDDINTAPVAVSITPQVFNNNTFNIMSKLKVGSINYDSNQKPYLNDLQVNIKPPYKIPDGIVSQLFERVRDKLSGMDKQLNPIIANNVLHNSERLPNRCPPDSKIPVEPDPTISNDLQSTDDQVDALIIEATSLENKAAMYEGWMSWV